MRVTAWAFSLWVVASSSVWASEPDATRPALYVSPQLSVRPMAEEDMTVYLIGDQMEATDDGKMRILGQAQVRRIDSVVKGDQIDYDRETGEVVVTGNGLIMRDGSISYSPSFRYNLDAETGTMQAPRFWLGDSGGAGVASEAELLSRNHTRLQSVVYSGCPCPEPAWYIKSPTLDLYSAENEGVAKHGVLYFKGVPLLYSPYLSFPIRKERKSGFLMPTYGMTTRSGLDISIPYYLNLAPNYDATLTPRFLAKRGLMLGGEFRYLGRGYNAELNGTYLARDKERDFARWFTMAKFNQRLGAGFSWSADMRRVSDDDYFRDFSSFGLNDATVQDLTSTVGLAWGGSKYVSASVRAYKYQTLQDATSSYRTPQYDRLPEFRVNARHYDWGGFDLVSENTATRFRMPFYSGRYTEFDRWRSQRRVPDGSRLSSYTTLSYPVVRSGWYVTPKAGLHMSHYETEWHAHALPQFARRAKQASRVLPIFSLDSGMTFERDTRLFGNASIQTLEPRLYYLYVPYRDQNDLPNFDTSLSSFNFAQAFSENIYSGGWDRISDANQLSLGLTTRWLDADTGFERLVLQAAQRLYFSDQRVTLPGRDARTDTRSDYLLGAYAALTNTFSVNFDAQFNPEDRQRNRMTTGVRWRPQRLATLAANYRYERDPDAVLYRRTFYPDKTKESVSLTAQWPLHNKLYAVGRYDYSLQESRSTQSILGLEYKGDCCWVGRVVVQRYAISAKDTNQAIFFQLELSGLGGIGNDPMRLLRDRVVGYQPVTTSTPEKTTFERYE